MDESLLAALGFRIREVWEGKVELAIVAHALVGFGVGLLVGPSLGGGARSLAFIALAASAVAHVYAWLTSAQVEGRQRAAPISTD